MATSRMRASSFTKQFLGSAPPVPSKQIGAEQLPSIDGTFEEKYAGLKLCFLGRLHQAHVFMEFLMNKAGLPRRSCTGERPPR